MFPDLKDILEEGWNDYQKYVLRENQYSCGLHVFQLLEKPRDEDQLELFAEKTYDNSKNRSVR